MNRRDFIHRTAASGVMALTFPKMPLFLKGVPMGIVVHSYGSRWNSKVESKKYPGFQNAVDLIDHCGKIGAGGVQVGVKDWTLDFSKKVRDRREKLGLYLEGSVGLPKKPEEVPAFEQEVKNGREAGARVLRAVSLGGRRYEALQTDEAFQAFRNNAQVALQLAEPVLSKHKMKLGVENHKDWLATELAEALKQLGSEWVGVTLDFGNNIALLEDSMDVARTLAPYVFSTHVKDMAVEEHPDGFLLSEVPLGQGILDLPRMVELCKHQHPDVTFNLEMITRDPLQIPCLKEDYWATFKEVPGSQLARVLQMVRKNTYKAGLPRISQLGAEEKLAVEEENVLTSLTYSKNKLRLS